MSQKKGKIPVQVMLVASEYEGLVKTGGLADVARALPAALAAAGVRVKVLVPCYRAILAQAPAKIIDRLSVPLNLSET
ncbi:MAG: glycogen/starch synthase, partial [Natronospirillum sp.]